MKKLLNIKEKILKKIKQSNLTKLLMFKAEIKELNEKVGDLVKEKEQLIDENTSLKLNEQKLTSAKNKIACLEWMIGSADKSIKEKLERNKQLEDNRIKLENELYEAKQELVRVNMQLELKEEEISELKSDRYLVRKIPSGRKPNTNKTKISKPMSVRVTNYMRGEHE